MDKTTGKILIEGNDAAAIGCLMAGVTFVGWYPITPSSSLPEYLIDYLKKTGATPKAVGPRTRSCKPRTSWLRSAW